MATTKRRPIAFISHSSNDIEITRRIVRLLRAGGVRCWFSKHAISGAEHWLRSIGKALKRCDWFVVLLTPAATKSKWVRHEVQYALQLDRYERRLLPLIVKKCDADKLAWPLVNFQAIDLRTDIEKGCGKAAKRILKLKRKR